MKINDQIKNLLQSNEQFTQADTLEATILINIITNNNNEIGEYFFNTVTEEYFFTNPGYYELYNIIKSEKQHKNSINFYFLENNLKITDKTTVFTLKQMSEQSDIVLNINDLNWKNKADIILQSHILLFQKVYLLQGLSNYTNEACKITDAVQLDTLLSYVGNLIERCKGKNYTFDEDQTKVSEKETANKVIDNIFSNDVYLETGFYNYDNYHRGFPLGSLVMIAATSGAGKSMVALNLAMNAYNAGKRVCLVSLEMTAEEIMKRMLCIVKNNPQFNKSYDENNKVKTTDFLKVPIEQAFIDNLKQVYNNWIEIVSNHYPEAKLDLRCENNDILLPNLLGMLKNYKYDLIIIDYIGLLRHKGKNDQWQELSQDAREAKIFAQNNNNVVVLLAQRERNNDVSFSKALIHHSNVFWIFQKIRDGETENAVCRKANDDPDCSEYITTIEILKNRNSSQKPFNLKLDYAHMTVNGGGLQTDDSWSRPSIISGIKEVINKQYKRNNINNSSIKNYTTTKEENKTTAEQQVEKEEHINYDDDNEEETIF